MFFETDFSEYTTGVQPSDWTERFYTASFTCTVEEDAVNGLNGKVLQVVSTTSSETLLAWDKLDDTQDAEVLVLASTDDLSDRHVPIVRGKYYSANVYDAYASFQDSVQSINYVRCLQQNTVYANILSSGTVPFLYDNQLIWIRLRIQGSSIKQKIWYYVNAEPEEWQIDGVDTTITAPGYIGVGTNGSCTITLYYFAADTQCNSIPIPEAFNTWREANGYPLAYWGGSAAILFNAYRTDQGTKLFGGIYTRKHEVITEVSIRIGTTHTTQARVAVYSGGTLEDPTGATLLVDCGETTGTDTSVLYTVSCPPTAVPPNTPLWIAIKWAGSGFSARYNRNISVAAYNYTVAYSTTSSGVVDYDPTVAYPAAIPAGFSSYIYDYSIFINFNTPPVTDDLSYNTKDYVEATTIPYSYAIGFTDDLNSWDDPVNYNRAHVTNNDFSTDPNCVAVYRLEPGNHLVDSKGSNTLTEYLGGNLSPTTGQYAEGAGALDFGSSGTSGALYRADEDLSADFPFKVGTENTTVSLTMWLWLNTTYSSNLYLGGKYGANSGFGGFDLVVPNNESIRLSIKYNNGANVSITTIFPAASITPRTPYFLAFTYDGATQTCYARLYNHYTGTFVEYGPTVLSYAISVGENSAPFVLGGYADTSTVSSAQWFGVQDEVVIFNDILTTDEMDAIYQGLYTGPPVTPLTITPAASALDLWGDALDIAQTSATPVDFSAQDDLNSWNDFLGIYTTINYHLPLLDNWGLLSDSLDIVTGEPNITVSIPDTWGLLDDSIDIHLFSPNITVSFLDDWNDWADSLSITSGLAVSPTDAIDTWGDDFGFYYTAHHGLTLVDALTIPTDGIATFAHLGILLMDHRPTIEDSLSLDMTGGTMYSYETFAQLKAQLAARLHDTSKVFWTDTELAAILQETFRTFSLLTWHWREQGTFNTIPGTEMYDIATELSSRLGHTLTDRNLINDIQYHFQEDPTADWAAGWAGTAMFSMDDVAHCLQKRRNKFLADTGCYITRTVADSGGPIGGRIVLADNIIDVRRVARDNSGVMTNLWRVNEEELTAFDTSWAAPAAQDPTEYSVMATPPLTVQLSPAPLAAATLDMLTVSAGSDFTPAVAATVVGVPDDMAWIVKWGAMADLLLKDGPARDPERAKYCEERYQHGVALARLATPIVQARIGSLPLTVCALAELDAYSPGWQSHTAALPTTLATAGMNYIALDPPPNVGVAVYLDVVQNAPVPSDDADLVQIGREMVSTILDYAVHLAMFKVGGGEWQATTQLMEQFLLMCGNYNKRMEAASRLWKDMHSVTNYEEATRRRMKTAGEPRTPENWGYGKPGGRQ